VDSTLTQLTYWHYKVICDEDKNRSRFPKDLAETVITSGETWNLQSRRIFQWLNSLDAKASHLGGRNLLSPKSLEVILRYRFGITDVEDDSDGDDFGSESLERNSLDQRSSSALSSSNVWGLDIERSPTSSALGMVKFTVFNTILQPALEFHIISQSSSRRIGSHDRHHRRRDTVDDEFEVVTSCRQFEQELQRLWRQRPKILDFTKQELSKIVCDDVAGRLEEVFSIYAASFWAHFIYIHRVAWWNLSHSATVTKAIDETWQMMRRSVREPHDTMQASTLNTVKVTIHPGLMWPLYLFGCETTCENQQQWAVGQLDSLGDYSIYNPGENEDSDGDALPSFNFEKGGVQNAKRAAALLKEQIKRQNKLKRRVDGKHLSQEMFGCQFSII
jgi:Fungal specific transcription factor domain